MSPRRVTARLKDGTALAGRAWLPDHGRPAPAVLVYHPYRNDCFDGLLLDRASAFFARHGYAAVMVDFRGVGGSGGSFAGEYGRGEGIDGAQLVAWAARQRWCDGTVGMWGMSWPGMAALRTAAEAPAELKAVAALMAPLDVAEELFRPGGCEACMVAPLTAANMLALQMLPPLDRSGGAWLPAWVRRLHGLRAFGLGEVPGCVVPAERIATPTLLVGGWRDIAVRGTLAAFERVRGPRRLLVGPWSHAYPDAAQVEPVDHLSELLRWWDLWLKGVEPGSDGEPAVVYHCQGRDAWRACADWPPAAGSRTLWLHRDHSLSERPAARGDVTYRADPTVGVGTARWDLAAMPLEQSDDDARSLCFGTDAGEGWLEIVGSPRVRLFAEPGSGDELQLVARLCDVAPSGRSQLIAVGQACRRDNGLRAPVDIELGPTAYALAPGHRLRLAISSGEFPFLWPSAAARDVRLRVGGECASAIAIPVAAGSAACDPPPPGALSPDRVDDRVSTVVERELERARLTVRSAASARLAGRTGIAPVELETISRAVVEHAHPERASAEVTIRIDSTTPAGAAVSVECGSHMTRAESVLRGRVELGGRAVAELAWRSAGRRIEPEDSRILDARAMALAHDAVGRERESA